MERHPRPSHRDTVLRVQAIGDVRGVGMFLGIDIIKDERRREADPVVAGIIVKRLKDRRILLQTDGPHNNVLKFKSPMCFDKQDADRYPS